MVFTSSYIVEKPEQTSSKDLLPAACLVISVQKSNKQRPSRTAKPAAQLVNLGLSYKKTQEKQQQFTQLYLLKNLYRLTSF